VAALLDVNILLSLLDPYHIQHEAAHKWFGGVAERKWASCPITQNGYIRIASQSRYTNPTTTANAAKILAEFIDCTNHIFWPDSIGFLQTSIIDINRVHGAGQITDIYLLALAKANGGQLVTLDTRFNTTAVSGGADHLITI
jgi:uncharacterized protein